jgi:hypothetical protein
MRRDEFGGVRFLARPFGGTFMLRVRETLGWIRSIPLWVVPLPLLAIVLLTAGAGSNPKTPASVTRYGPAVVMGKGTARSWVKYDEQGVPRAVGLAVDEAALKGLPTTSNGKGCCEGEEYLLELPADAPAPFNHIAVNWNPQGHEPAGIYDKPHFDFHFYMMKKSERDQITLSVDDAKRAGRPLPENAMPEGYVLIPETARPRMGAHMVNPKGREFQGKPFTRTLIYGAYDGKMTFIEPMITKAYLESKPNQTELLALPKQYPSAGYFPTAYTVKWDPSNREFLIALEGLTLR